MYVLINCFQVKTQYLKVLKNCSLGVLQENLSKEVDLSAQDGDQEEVASQHEQEANASAVTFSSSASYIPSSGRTGQ